MSGFVPSFYIIRDNSTENGWELRIDISDVNYFIGPKEIELYITTGKFPESFTELQGYSQPPPDFTRAHLFEAISISSHIENIVLAALIKKLGELTDEEQETLLPITKLAIEHYRGHQISQQQ